VQDRLVLLIALVQGAVHVVREDDLRAIDTSQCGITEFLAGTVLTVVAKGVVRDVCDGVVLLVACIHRTIHSIRERDRDSCHTPVIGVANLLAVAEEPVVAGSEPGETAPARLAHVSSGAVVSIITGFTVGSELTPVVRVATVVRAGVVVIALDI